MWEIGHRQTGHRCQYLCLYRNCSKEVVPGLLPLLKKSLSLAALSNDYVSEVIFYPLCFYFCLPKQKNCCGRQTISSTSTKHLTEKNIRCQQNYIVLHQAGNLKQARHSIRYSIVYDKADIRHINTLKRSLS